MSKTSSNVEHSPDNPFLTDKSDELWARLNKEGKPVSKEELLKRVKALKEKKGL